MQFFPRMAATFNLPMISHYCSNGATSDKRFYKTFARTRPPSTIVTKSLASLLLKYNWTRIAFFRPMSSKLRLEVIQRNTSYSKMGNKSHLGPMPNKKHTPGGYEHIAVSMKKMFKELQIDVRYEFYKDIKGIKNVQIEILGLKIGILRFVFICKLS